MRFALTTILGLILFHSARAAEPSAVPAEQKSALQNLLPATEGIYVGGEPHGEAAFAELERLGVKTIVSVDGARPDVAAARRHGLRYVHIPFGYDGVDPEAGLALTRVAREISGPIYVHCHHGKHRGPAGAAVLCLSAGKLDHNGALTLLKKAGTSPDYPGLWRDVEHFQPPPADAKLPELVEVAEIGSLAAAMAVIDRAYDHLKLCSASGWKSPVEHPDLEPSQEALLLKEAFVETVRNLPAEQGAQLCQWLHESVAEATLFEAALKGKRTDDATRAFELLNQSCQRCHEKYRN